MSALTIACQRQKWSFVMVLLSHKEVDADSRGPSQQKQYEHQQAYQRRQAKRMKGEALAEIEEEYNICSVMHLAVEAGRLDVMKAALAAGADANAVTLDTTAVPVIAYAAACRKPELLLHLATLPAVDINAANADGDNALLLCARNDHTTMAELLRNDRIAVNAVNKKGESVIHTIYRHHSGGRSSHHGSFQSSNRGGHSQPDPWIVIRDTVMATNPAVDLFQADAEGITACHLACTQPWLLGFAHMFSSEELLSRTLNAKTKRGTTPLSTSVLHGQESFALRLLERGANPNDCVQVDSGRRISIVQYLMGRNPQSPVLFMLLEHEQLDLQTTMVDSIVCDQLKLGVKCFDGRVDYPEHILSLLTQQKDAVESYVTLLSRLSTVQKKGMYMHVDEVSGRTPLHLAIDTKPTAVVDTLLEHCPDPAVLATTDTAGQTPVHVAVAAFAHSTETLLTHARRMDAAGLAALVNAKDHLGNTALHYCLCPSTDGTYRFNAVGIAKLLLAAGADCMLANNANQTPLAMVGQHAERYLPLFLESGTKATEKVWQSIDKDGSGTLDIKELGAACSQMGKQLSEEQLAGMFQQMDTAGRGEVGYDKFVEWWQAEVKTAVEASSQAVQKQAAAAAAQRQLEHTQDTEALAAATAQRAALIESQAKQAEEWLTMQRKNTNRLNVPVMPHFAYSLSQVAVLVDGEDIFDAMMTKVDRDFGVVGLNQFYHIQLLVSTKPVVAEVTAAAAAAAAAVAAVATAPVLTGKLARLEQREREKSPFREAAAAAVPNQRQEPRFTVIKHWGRIGEDNENGYDSDGYGYGYGQSLARKKGWAGETSQQFHTLEEARKEFVSVFEQKTEHSWDSRYEKRDYATKRYNFVMTSYALKIDPAERDTDAARSVLPPAVKTFMRTISDADALRRGMAESGVDETLLPVGKLSLPQIKEAYELLDKLAKNLKKTANYEQNYRGKAQVEARAKISKLQAERKRLTDQFYILIPHKAAAGRRISTSRLPDITLSDMNKKLEMLNSLVDIHEAHTLLSVHGSSPQRSSLDVVYERLCTHMEPVDKSSAEFALVEKLLKNGARSSDHSIEYLLRARRAEDAVRFEPHACRRLETGGSVAGARPRNLLLWHGTRGFNMVGILSQGLRIAPPEAPVSGYMFGKGIYFADMFQKSQGYCDSSQIMMLCEVAVGNSMCLNNAKYVEKLPPQFDSTQGMGRIGPDADSMSVLPDGVGVSLGARVNQDASQEHRVLNYNEYIVYDVSQVQIKYILKFNTSSDMSSQKRTHSSMSNGDGDTVFKM
eukprot:SAG22_NODE_36_length_27184_cov_65.870076_3_plen_1288_part_00